jgi:hypothetical protein
MIPARRFNQSPLRDFKRLIGEATEPQGAGEAEERTDAIIKTEEVGAEGAKLDREC